MSSATEPEPGDHVFMSASTREPSTFVALSSMVSHKRRPPLDTVHSEHSSAMTNVGREPRIVAAREETTVILPPATLRAPGEKMCFLPGSRS